MSRIETTATVAPNGQVTLPSDLHLPPGRHRVVIDVEDGGVPARDPAEVMAAFRAARGAFSAIDTPLLHADVQAQRA